MVKAYNKSTKKEIKNIYVDRYENVYEFKKAKKNSNIVIKLLNDECLVTKDIGYVDKNNKLLFEYDIVSTDNIKHGVIINYDCTYIIMDYFKEQYYFLNSFKKSEVEYVGNIVEDKIYDKDGNVVEIEFVECEFSE